MKTSQVLSVVALVLLWSGSAMAQDAVKVDPAHYKLVMENASVRILRISYAPGATSITHQHPDSIVIPLSASKVRFTLPDVPFGDAFVPELDTGTPSGVPDDATPLPGGEELVLPPRVVWLLRALRA